jgi:hypothetical protein
MIAIIYSVAIILTIEIINVVIVSAGKMPQIFTWPVGTVEAVFALLEEKSPEKTAIAMTKPTTKTMMRIV